MRAPLPMSIVVLCVAQLYGPAVTAVTAVTAARPRVQRKAAPAGLAKSSKIRSARRAAALVAPLPRQATEGTLPPPPNFAAIGRLRDRRAPPTTQAAAARQRAIATLRSKLSRTPTDPAVPRWLHSVAQLEYVEALWQHLQANRARARAVAARAKEKRQIDRKIRHHKRKVATAIRRHWGLPKPPDTRLKTVIPPPIPVDLHQAIRDYETIVANHPRYRRMDDVLLRLGHLHIQDGRATANIPSLATGEQYLNQMLHEFGWSPLAAHARVLLADLALSRGNVSQARDYLTDLAENERAPAVRDYARLRLARLLARTDIPKSITALRQLASTTPDSTLRAVARQQAAALGGLLPATKRTLRRRRGYTPRIHWRTHRR